jgi:two-component system LytT family response regulator
MELIRSIIIEDNPEDSLHLKGILVANYPEIEVLAICPTLAEGIIEIVRHRPAVIFLDIELPHHSGLEIAKFLNASEKNFEIIFTTWHTEFAFQSYEVDALYYLSKPVSIFPLSKAITRLKKRIVEKNLLHQQVIKEIKNSPKDTKIEIATMDKKYYFSPHDLIYFNANGAYTQIYSENQPMLYVGKNIGYFEELVAKLDFFMRVHRSFLLNLWKVAIYTVNDEQPTILLKDHTSIPLSTQKVAEFQEKIKLLTI